MKTAITITITLAIMGLSSTIQAQELVGSAGSEASNSSVDISYSIGETVVSTTTPNTVSQGYQQSYITATGIGEIDGLEISLFPNPTSGQITVTTSGKKLDKLMMIDATGRLVWSSETINQNTLEIDMSAMANGAYFLSAKTADNAETTTHKILKTN